MENEEQLNFWDWIAMRHKEEDAKDEEQAYDNAATD
mgnify:CR=1 FL=1|jgi:hypothetical protein|tara:strand:+ start:177 stop:284 length:108 start_codon:yes stop_codon:yes gene_type:complete